MAREEFIKTESSGKIKRALRHNVRPSVNNKFYTGDLIYYKRRDDGKWKGPGKVIGNESYSILIKHGSQYVRAHACIVLLDKRGYNSVSPDNNQEEDHNQKEDYNQEE